MCYVYNLEKWFLFYLHLFLLCTHSSICGLPWCLRWKESSCNAGDLGWEDPLEKEMATHSSILAWRIPMDRGEWRATVHGVAKSRTGLSAVQHPFSDTLLLCRSKFLSYVTSSLLKNFFPHLLQGSLLVTNSLNLCFSGSLYLSFLRDIFARYQILRWWGIFPQHF